MTHPALEARARGALKPLPDEPSAQVTFPLTLSFDVYMALIKAARSANMSADQLIEDILLDTFPVEAPR